MHSYNNSTLRFNFISVFIGIYHVEVEDEVEVEVEDEVEVEVEVDGS